MYLVKKKRKESIIKRITVDKSLILVITCTLYSLH